MLRQEPPRIDPDSNGHFSQVDPSDHGFTSGDATRTGGIDIQRELNQLEVMILDSPRIPLLRRTLIDEEPLLDQLDLVRLNLPAAFQEAEEVVRQKEEILLQAEEYAQQIIEAAERRADQILDEMGIIRQAELEAKQIRQAVQQECEAIQEQTLAEIERMRLQAQQELDQMRRAALGECDDIQNGADDYADQVLNNIEQHLGEMLRVIRNGRQQLQAESPSVRPQKEDSKSNKN